MKVFVLFLGLVLFVFVPLQVHGHELIPKELQNFIQAHPQATTEEIQRFISRQIPAVAEQFRDKAKILELIRNPQTNFLDNSFDFLKLGINHILSGADHILFVLSILLVFESIQKILKLTSTFTIAHSITLALAGFGILTLSPRIVEPFIAFSISFTALTTVFLKDKKLPSLVKNKVAIVFFFGLFHGLGFAGILKEIGIPSDRFISSLLSFNLGIELGQLCIVALALPVLFIINRQPWRDTFIKIIAVVLTATGIVWGIQRIIG